MKFLILLVLLGLLGIFTVQNLQLIQLKFFGGILSLTLPIVAWIILFTLAGLLTSLLLQLLARSFRSSSSAKSRPVTPSPPPLKPEFPQQPPREPSYAAKDPLFDDWDIQPPENPPQPLEDTELQEFPQRKVSQQPLKDEEIPSFEVPRSPQKVSQSGTIYSYTYREAEAAATKPPEKNPQQQVYDADYRVITPPYRHSDNPSPTADDDSEEWV